MNKRELRKWRENYADYDGTPVTEGLRLEVHFDEKDYVKHIGCRWEPNPSGKGGYWYIPTNRLQGPMPSDIDEIINIFEAPDLLEEERRGEAGVLSRLEWLNKNKMINGTHGDINMDAVIGAIEDIEPTEHEVSDAAGKHGHFYVYATVGVVSYTPNGDNPNIDYNREYMTVEQAREKWDDFMEQGYRKVKENNE